MLIVNKSDLRIDTIQPELEEYRKLHLDCIAVSCQTADGIAELEHRFAGSVTLLVGQSGVGKSSLVNALAPLAAAQTAELTRDAEGRHTTTTARWYQLTTHPLSSMLPASATLRRPRTWCAPRSAVSSRFMNAARNAGSMIAVTWRSPAAPCAPP